jgi:hypothetical protein
MEPKDLNFTQQHEDNDADFSMPTTLVQQVIDGRFVPFVAVEQFFAVTP